MIGPFYLRTLGLFNSFDITVVELDANQMIRRMMEIVKS